MTNSPFKFTSLTSYLYEVAFNDDQQDAADGICLDCLNQEHPWQSLRASQNKLDELLSKIGKKDRKAERELNTLKLQLFVLTCAEQRMAIYGELYSLVEELKPVRQQIQNLDNTIKRLKRINHNQSGLLKQLKANLLGARGDCAQYELQQQINDIEIELMSLWQRCIGAELDKLALMKTSIEYKQQAVALLDRELDKFCTTPEADSA